MYKISLVLLGLMCIPLLVGCGKKSVQPTSPSSASPVSAKQQYATLPPIKVNPIDGAEMALIPAGEFLMGTSEEELAVWLKENPTDKRESFVGQMPQHKVDIDSFYMYKTEVTVAQYRAYCTVTKHAMPEEPDYKWVDSHPIVNVTWDDAKSYADWAGASLPTEAKWEKAASGGDRRIYPWGNAWPPPAKVGNLPDETTKRKYPLSRIILDYNDGYANVAPVGSFTANPYGLHDMAGNVTEWCMDWYSADSYKGAPTRNPTGPEMGAMRVVRGSDWGTQEDDYDYRVAFRGALESMERHYALGFRCVVPAPAK
ncbi:MAG: SUMF1/EgtB/PvdO family nonheme iron enzyme [bacterium]